MDLTGKKFGKLTVVSLKVKKPYSRKSYNCLCDCGNSCVRLESTLKKSLRDERISSCGCYSNQFLIPRDSEGCRKAGLHRKDSFVDGSNIQMTLRDGTIKTNTSGCQGVSWSKTARKWHCFIGYQNYRANLGYYEDKEDAVRIRSLAEQAVRDGKFEDFYFRIRGHKLGEKQNKQFKHKV